ncbi:hypothetical protein GGU11DRAFT_715709 [Lentinula aff. detonsa]|nr:hypothetical protein GGU11DRAFT_715709 [Lentinula aff. detonsa]
MVNVTIDDSAPSVIYYPSSAWNSRSASTPCTTCTANPDTDRMFDNTFHDGTFSPTTGSNDFPNVPLTASIVFNGTAVYVFCALAESSTSPDGDSDMSFYIDGSLKGTFVKTAPGNSNVYDYSIPVFSIDSLPSGMHNFTLQNGHVNGTKSLVLLDEIIYTTVDDNSSSSSSSSSSSQTSTTAASSASSSTQGSSTEDTTSSTKQNLGSIIGPAVAVPVVLILAAIGLCFFLRRRKRQRVQQQSNQRRTTLDSPGPVTAAWTSEPLSIPHSNSALSGGIAPFSSRQNLSTNTEAAASGTSFYDPYAQTQPQSSVYVSSTSGGDTDGTPTSASFQPRAVDGELPPAYDQHLNKARGANLRLKDRKTVVMNN